MRPLKGDAHPIKNDIEPTTPACAGAGCANKDSALI